MDFSFYLIVAVTFFGFIGLAFILLFPVYRFLNRETELSEEWTPEALAERRRQQLRDGTTGGDGAPAPRTASLPGASPPGAAPAAPPTKPLRPGDA